MKDINLHTDSFHLLIDPVYGPNSQYFWPGSYMDAKNYVMDPIRGPVYVSGEAFLENYAKQLSGVLAYRDSTDYPEESYCDALYEKFYSLWNHGTTLPFMCRLSIVIFFTRCFPISQRFVS